jgi:shikimate kinase
VAEGWHIALITDKINTQSVELNVQSHYSIQEPINVSLYDKDTITIQQYIQGKWQVLYATGGWYYYAQYFDDYTNEFTADKKYIISTPSGSYTTEYHWRRISGAYAGYNDSVYIMSPYDMIVFDKIKNDTLVYHELSSEAMWYYLIKSQK